MTKRTAIQKRKFVSRFHKMRKQYKEFFEPIIACGTRTQALFEKLNAFISTKNCKNICCLGGGVAF